MTKTKCDGCLLKKYTRGCPACKRRICLACAYQPMSVPVDVFYCNFNCLMEHSRNKKSS